MLDPVGGGPPQDCALPASLTRRFIFQACFSLSEEGLLVFVTSCNLYVVVVSSLALEHQSGREETEAPST